MSVTLEFRPQFDAKIRQLISLLEPEAMEVPMLASGMVLANRAREKAPVKTGTLRRSIRAEANPEDRGTILVGSDVPYAARIEFGFEGADRLGRVYHQAPRPYLRPAFDESQEEMKTAMLQAIRTIIARAG